MKNKINFVTGETYSLSEIFSGNRQIVIPDLQRDYCWGDAVHTRESKELVSGFVEGLFTQFNAAPKQPLMMGIIYGYESPKDHIQLCDGQQRMTTLFLLLGMINRKLHDNPLLNFLFPPGNEGQPQREPYLRYAIRETTLYFLRDLTNMVFVSRAETKTEGNIEDLIFKSDWFFQEYARDPSTRSMMAALKTIEQILGDINDTELQDFSYYLLNNLKFMYHDMEGRKNGEETFVVINTTGEPLAPTENLKPHVIAEKINVNYSSPSSRSLSQDWEEIETWFWNHRLVRNGNDTADAGFNEFLRWVSILYYAKGIPDQEGNSAGLRFGDKKKVEEILSSPTHSFPVSEIPFASVYQCWQALKFLFEKWNNWNDKCIRPELKAEWISPRELGEPASRRIDQIDAFVLLPLLAWILNHCPNALEVEDIGGLRNLLRFHCFFENLKRLESVRKSVNTLVYDAINMAKGHQDIIEVLGKQHYSRTIITEEELEKLQILQAHAKNRCAIEEAFWAAQRQKLWNGEIRPLLKWAKNNNEFSLEVFQNYERACNELFVGNVFVGFRRNGDRDKVRRALLTRNLTNYPLRIGKNLTFCNTEEQWKTTIFGNDEKIKQFIDDLLVFSQPRMTINQLEKMIEDYGASPAESKWGDFICHSRLLELCEEKNIQDDSQDGILLIRYRYATARNCFKLSNIKWLKTHCGAKSIEYFDWQKIVFHSEIDGDEYCFQWLLHPGDGEADISLMENNSPNSYCEKVKGTEQENNTDYHYCFNIENGSESSNPLEKMKALVELYRTQCKMNQVAT